MDQKLLQEAAQLEQYTRELEEHDAYLQKQIAELEQFKAAMETFVASGEKRLLAPLGKGVYCKADIAEQKLFVEVGSGILVRKTPDALLAVVDEQLQTLGSSQIQLSTQITLCAEKLQGMMAVLEKQHQAEHESTNEE
jgi:prefoldin alpha subunit